MAKESSNKIPVTSSLNPKKKENLFIFLGRIYEEDKDFSRAAETYLEALKMSPGDTTLRASLARVYQEGGDEDSAEREYEIILDSSARDLTSLTASVRLKAIKYISPIPGPEADSLLRETLNDPDISVRQAGALELGKRGEEEAIDILIQSLSEDSRNATRAASILAQMKVSKAVPIIAEGLSDNRPGHRRTSASCLGNMGDPGALEYLLPCLKDDNYLMRKTTVYALGKLHDRRAVTPLIVALNDDAAIVKKLAAYSLGELGGPEAIEPLETLLKDTTDSNHLYAALALAKLGEPVDTKIFLDHLNANDFFYRGTAIEGLEASGDLEAARSIIPMLKDKTSWVRIIAAEALAKLHLLESRDALIENMKIYGLPDRVYSAAALWNLGEESGPALLRELMDSPYPEKRELAARVLRYVKDDSRRELLDKALNDPSLIVRRIAEESLQAKEKIIE